MRLLTEFDAEKKLKYLLAHESEWKDKEHRVSGYYHSNGIFVAFDNTTGDCYVEDFSTKIAAHVWACGNE